MSTSPQLFIERLQKIYARMPRLMGEVKAVSRTIGPAATATYLRNMIVHANDILATNTLRSADEAMQGAEWTFELFGTNVKLDGRFFSSAREMYCRRVYFSRPGFRIADGDLVVDLGANIGLFSVLAAKLGARVISVEAQRSFAPIIEDIARRNNCLNRIELETAMVGAGGSLGWAESTPSESTSIVAPKVPFGDLLASHAVAVIDFLKIDIEGSEYDLIMRNSGWLDSVRKIAMEVHTLHGDQIELAEYLRGRNFDVELTTNEQRSIGKIEESSGYLFARKRKPN